MAMKQTVPPSTYPVTLAEAKLHLRVDVVDDDTLITALITAATDQAHHMVNRAIMTQTWTLTLDSFPDAIELTRMPVQSVTSVKYVDTNGVQQTLSSSLYSVDLADDFGYGYIVPAYNTTWPDTRDQVNAVEVVYVAGYASAAAVPQLIKTWILLRIASLYENRAAWTMGRDVINENPAVDRLLDRYRVGLYAA
jgi:uncharacterized phiE125 gp8 family phage protein